MRDLHRVAVLGEFAPRQGSGSPLIYSGPGVRDPQRIFDHFYTTKPVGKGMGLGLSVTYGVVRDHQGEINCENRPEGGAVFTLRFPTAKRSAPMVETAKA